MLDTITSPAHTATSLDDTIIQTFKAQFRGDLLRPGDAGYNAARVLFNANVDKHPALIARCVDVADVIAAVNFGREHGIEIAVRAGGHSVPGQSMVEGGLVIDLSRLKGIRVDPTSQTVRVEAGCLWEDVDHATSAFGLTVPSGIFSNTGVAGLTLGGGHGYLTRKLGLTIDSLLEADVVLADGRFVTANANENADLFWALRGGGGNFGVVTSFLFKAHAINTVTAGLMFWPFEKAAEIMRLFCDTIAQAPDELNGWCGPMFVLPAPIFPEALHMQKVIAIMWCHCGALGDAEASFKPIRAWAGGPVLDWVSPMPIAALNSMFNAVYVPGTLHWYAKGDIFNEVSDEAIALHVKYGEQLPTLLSGMHLYPINGAVQRVGETDTPWAYRKSLFSSTYFAVDPDIANFERMREWARDYWLALHPHSAGGAYVNFVNPDDGPDRIESSYRGNYARLAQLKAQYDPQNLFHLNGNIKPA